MASTVLMHRRRIRMNSGWQLCGRLRYGLANESTRSLESFSPLFGNNVAPAIFGGCDSVNHHLLFADLHLGRLLPWDC